METGRMVVVNRVAKFVDDHIVAQVLRKSHQKEAQRDVVAPRTAPPLRARGADRKFPVLQPRRLRQPRNTPRQVGFRRAAEFFDTGLLLLGRQLRRQGCPFAGQPFARRPDPGLFLLQKSQSPFLRHPAGKRQPHGPRGAHRNGNAAGAHGLRGSPRPAGDAHRPRSSHQHSIDRHSLYYNGRVRTFQLNIFEQNPATVIAVIQQPQQLLRRRPARFGRIESTPFQLAFQQIPTGNPVYGSLLPPKTDEAYRY